MNKLEFSADSLFGCFPVLNLCLGRCASGQYADIDHSRSSLAVVTENIRNIWDYSFLHACTTTTIHFRLTPAGLGSVCWWSCCPAPSLIRRCPGSSRRLIAGWELQVGGCGSAAARFPVAAATKKLFHARHSRPKTSVLGNREIVC